ncbi:C-C motif chemokine 20-like [Cyprinodon tularosa]|uniref:C-C motif chemokine 20-like n=1 Tax=Cyprinodon tularosa TaxID=77115 RepID=UPI0018E27967|nr:C-C motif chemokine 20-like [Cyprinodon tularosa]
MASKVAALLLIGLICFEFAAAEIAVDCCLRVESEKRLHRRNLVSYTIQRAGEGCKISATVFVNQRNMKLCVVPPEGNPGVQKIIDYLDKKRQSHQ